MVITQATRQEALRRASLASRAQQDLARQRQQIQTQRAIRGQDRQGLARRQQQVQAITREGKRLEVSKRKLQDIAKQDTVQEAQAKQRAKLIGIIQRGLKGNVGSEFSKLSKAEQRLVTQSIGKAEDRFEKNLISQVEENLKMTLNPQQRIDVVKDFKKNVGTGRFETPELDAASLGVPLEDARVGMSRAFFKPRQSFNFRQQPAEFEKRILKKSVVRKEDLNKGLGVLGVKLVELGIPRKFLTPAAPVIGPKQDPSSAPAIVRREVTQFGEEATGLVNKGLGFVGRQADKILPRKFSFVQDTRFFSGGTSAFDPRRSGNGFFVPESQAEPVIINERAIREFTPVNTNVFISQSKEDIGKNFLPTKLGGQLFLDAVFLPAFVGGVAAKAESKFVQNQITGEFIKKSELKKRFADLLDSGVNRITMNGRTINIPEETRALINKFINNPKELAKLREFYKRSGRSDLFDDILKQERLVRNDLPDSSILSGGGAEAKFVDSEFAGLGQFETTGAISPPLSISSETKDKQNLFIKTSQLTDTQLDVQSDITQTKQKPGLFFKPISKVKVGERLRFTPVITAIPREKTAIKQKTEQKQEFGFKSPTPPFERSGGSARSTLKKIPKIPILPPRGGDSSIQKEAQLKRKAYDVFIKRRGTWRKVGNDLPLGKALKRMTNKLKQSPASHGRVKLDPKGRLRKGARDSKFRPNPEVFRNFRIVKGQRRDLPRGPKTYEYIERKTKRLTTGFETRGLVASRRKNVFNV